MAAENPHSPLEKFVARASQLYTLPKVAMEVLELTSCPQVDATKLKQCIERDPALVGKILRTVNSSLFGGVRDVTDLNQAIALLGIKPLKLLVLGFSLPPKLLSGIEQSALTRYWKRTLVKAIAARELSSRYDNVDADDAFLAGLLQDIGMLALLKELGQPYADFLHQAHSGSTDLVLLELETLGFDHRLLSARMLQSWGLPEMLWRTIAASTSVEALPRSGSKLGESTSLLATADGVSLLMTRQHPAALAAVMQREEEEDVAWWTDFASRLQEQVEQMAGIFDVAALNDQRFDEIIKTAHQQLASAAEDAAIQLAAHDVTSDLPATSGQDISALDGAVQRFSRAALESFHGLDRADGRVAQSKRESNVATAVEPESTSILATLSAAVATCRRRRQPLSLLILEVDEFEELVFQSGGALAAGFTSGLRAGVELFLEGGQTALISGEAQLALLLAGDDRLEAVATARRILDEARSGHLVAQNGVGQPISMSIGIASVALPAKNFPAEDLQEAALRCLSAVQSCGGDNVKSIDVY